MVAMQVIGAQLFLEAESFSYSEAAPVKVVATGFDGVKGVEFGQQTLTRDVVELGSREKQWSLSLFSRYDYYLSYHPDVMELLYLEANDKPLVPGRSFDFGVRARHWRAQGVKVGWSFNYQPFDLKLTVGLFDADQIIEGRVDGIVSADSAGALTGNLEIDYAYYNDYLFRRPLTERPSGHGYTADLALEWRVSDRTQINLTINDLVGEVSWNSAPYTQAIVNTDRSVRVNEQGLLEIRPILEGQEGFGSVQQRIPTFYQLNTTLNLTPSIDTSLHWRRLESVDFYQLAVKRHWRAGQSLELSYDMEHQAYGMAWQANHVELGLFSDDWSLEEAHYLVFQVSLLIPLNLRSL